MPDSAVTLQHNTKLLQHNELYSQRHISSHKASEPAALTPLWRYRVTEDILEGGKSCSASGDGPAEVGDSQHPTKYTSYALVPASTVLQNTHLQFYLHTWRNILGKLSRVLFLKNWIYQWFIKYNVDKMMQACW